MDSEILKLEDAAKLLTVSPHSLRHWTMKGVGPPHLRFGNRIRFRKCDLLDWIESRIVRGGTDGGTPNT